MHNNNHVEQYTESYFFALLFRSQCVFKYEEEQFQLMNEC
jgi:hypothetical protein